MSHRRFLVPEAGRENGGETYALGWRVYDWTINNDRRSKSYNHHGVSIGGISAFAVFPEEGIVISAMINKNGTNAKELTKIIGPLISTFIQNE